MNNNWESIFLEEFDKSYFQNLIHFIEKEEAKYTVFPKKEERFNAFKLTPFEKVKCVIIGQDPYHGIGQAHGLAFSVKEGVKLPPSLINIFKELYLDLGIEIPKCGDLSKWAKEGVLLLNSVLTVRENVASSHANMGWEIFSDTIIKHLNYSSKPICFILWGNYAKNKQKLITNEKHLILTGTHPSPLSSYNGFFNRKYFSKTNEFLIKTNQTPIDWDLNK